MRLAAILIAVALLLSACSSGGAPASAGSTVMVVLTDKAITLDQATVDGGVVTFRVMNMGTIVHSLVLLKTDVPQDQIPPDKTDGSKVDQTGLIRETGQIAVGAMKETSVKLAAGKYVLVCNEPAHYIVGMHTALTVR